MNSSDLATNASMAMGNIVVPSSPPVLALPPALLLGLVLLLYIPVMKHQQDQHNDVLHIMKHQQYWSANKINIIFATYSFTLIPDHPDGSNRISSPHCVGKNIYCPQVKFIVCKSYIFSASHISIKNIFRITISISWYDQVHNSLESVFYIWGSSAFIKIFQSNVCQFYMNFAPWH